MELNKEWVKESISPEKNRLFAAIMRPNDS